MSEHLGYIDSYFNKELSPEECRIFDLRIEQDPVFAEEVAFYLNTLNSVKSELASQKKERFREIYQEIRPVQRPGLVRRFWPYASAAAVTVAIVFRFLFFNAATTPLKLADEYINGTLYELSPTMGAVDNIENAKSLYNNKQYAEALKMFETIISTDSSQTEAIKFAGITSLRLEDYNKSIQFFTQLENTRLQENYGKFLHAVVLMKRNGSGDSEEAKKLLTDVVDEKLSGKETAKKWLDKWQ